MDEIEKGDVRKEEMSSYQPKKRYSRVRKKKVVQKNESPKVPEVDIEKKMALKEAKFAEKEKTRGKRILSKIPEEK